MDTAGTTEAQRTLPPPGALGGSGELVALDRIRPDHGGRDAAPLAIRVVIADSEALLRAGLRILLEACGRIRVVGEARTGEEAIAVTRGVRPNVALIDERLPGLDCVEVTSRIVSESRAAVLVLSATEADERMLRALRAGASGLLLRDTEPAELVRAVDELAQGRALLSPGFTRRLIAELSTQPDPACLNSDLVAELSAREREVVALVARGLDNAEIAQRLVVSPATAKTHVSRAMVKLRVRDRAKLVVLAYKAGLVVPSATAPAPRPGAVSAA
jgi:DNA-binding NarL/FixJ family response regulator